MMDPLNIFLVLLIVYISTCLAITVLSDSDILTFICYYIGKQPADAYRDKVVWITGGSSGIGESIAKELAKCEGAKIVLSARRKEELERVKRECLESNPSREPSSILVLPLDVTDYTSHEPALKNVIETFGKLDILISNAGRSQRAKWDEISTEVDKQMFELNVFSLVQMNRIVFKHFVKVGKGHLVAMSSIAGRMGIPNSASYTASKYALHGYFESLRNETRDKNIAITTICPGPTFSDFLKEAFTANPGEKVNQHHSPTDYRMTAERCAHLSLVGIANQLEEIWISLFPFIFLLYLGAYLPFVYSKVIGPLYTSGYFNRLRDNKTTFESSKSK